MIMWLLKSLFWAIDNLLRIVVHFLYELIIQIASATVFQDYIWEFMDRIYTFLAIFMLFKLSISMVNYVLNPDQFSDKSKGFGKLIQSVIVVIALIIFVPTIFDWAYKLQCIVLNSGVLTSVITGLSNDNIKTEDEIYQTCFNSDDSCSTNGNLLEENSHMLTYSLMSAFVYGGGSGDENSIPSDITGDNPAAMNGSQNCAYRSASNPNGDKTTYKDASDCLFSYNTMTNSSQNTYIFLVSTLALGFVAYVFLTFTIDVSVRSVKLAFLQLMAPIPIISMLDPSSGKNGMFSKWLKECTKTYLDLFIRLGAVYFAIELIKRVFTSDICGNNMLVKVFIVLGLLAFAKQLPKFISDITGANFGGDGLSLKKKFGGIPGLGKAGAAGLGLAGGMAANALAARQNFKGQGLKGFGKGLASTLAGGGSAAFRGLTSKDKNVLKAGQGAIKGSVDKRNLRDQRQATGYTLGRRIGAGIDTFAGLDPMAKFEGEIKQYDDFEKQSGNILNRASSEMIKYSDLALSNGLTMAAHKREKERLTALENTDTSQMTSAELFRHTDELSRLRDRVNINDKKFANAYVDAVMNGKTLHKADGTAVNMGDVNDKDRDIQMVSMVQGLENTISTSSNETISGISLRDSAGNFNGNIKSAKDNVSNKKTEVTNSAEYQRALANKKQK